MSLLTLEEIAAALQNGFHDALLRSVTVDYVAHQAIFELRAWVGDVAAAQEADREAYRPITLTISGLLWWIIESPNDAGIETGDELCIDAGPISSLKATPAIPAVPGGAFAWWIFVRQWNAFMYVAGREASIQKPDTER